MELFESLYHLMFNAATDALRAMEQGDFVRAQSILVRAQRAAETRYLDETEE